MAVLDELQTEYAFNKNNVYMSQIYKTFEILWLGKVERTI